MAPSPFADANFMRQVAEIEFRALREALPTFVITLKKKIPRLEQLENYYSFCETVHSSQEIQIRFGGRTLAETTSSGAHAIEEGARLVYSLWPDGILEVSLYPACSNVSRMHEDNIMLRCGRSGMINTLDRLERDVRDLVAYGFVSGLETSATFADRGRICWLRHTRATRIDAKLGKPFYATTLGWLGGFVAIPIAIAAAVARRRPTSRLSQRRVTARDVACRVP